MSSIVYGIVGIVGLYALVVGNVLLCMACTVMWSFLSGRIYSGLVVVMVSFALFVPKSDWWMLGVVMLCAVGALRLRGIFSFS